MYVSEKPVTVDKTDTPFEECKLPEVLDLGVDVLYEIIYNYQLYKLLLPSDTIFVQRQAKPDKWYQALVLRLWDEVSDPTVDRADYKIYVIPELWPRRVYVGTRTCELCNDINCTSCLASKLRIKTSTEILDNCRAYDMHKHCQSKAFQQFICDVVGFAARLQIVTAGKVMGITRQDLLKEYARDSKQEIVMPAPEQKPVVPIPEPDPKVINADFHVDEVDPGKFTLFFQYKGKSRKRTLKLSEDDAVKLLHGLYAVEQGESADDFTKTYLRRLFPNEETAELLKAYEEDNARLTAELRNAKGEIEELRSRNHLLQSRLDNESTTISYGVDEMFPNEVNYHILNALHEYLSNSPSRGRRRDVLATICSNNPRIDISSSIVDKLSQILLNNSLHSPRTQREIKDLGFSIEMNGEGHFNVFPDGHPEYTVCLSATPSDRRTRQNEIRNMARLLF